MVQLRSARKARQTQSGIPSLDHTKRRPLLGLKTSNLFHSISLLQANGLTIYRQFNSAAKNGKSQLHLISPHATCISPTQPTRCLMGRHRSHPTGTGKACQGHSLKDFAASGCKGREDSLRDRTSREKIIMKNKIRSHIASEHGCHWAIHLRSWNYSAMNRYLRHLWIWSRPLSLITAFFSSTVTQEAMKIVIPQRNPKSLVQN